MAYLGIRNLNDLNGLYHFTSLAMAEEIGRQIEGSSFYLEKELKKALNDFSIGEADIRNGRILMDRYRNTENDMAYAAISGTPFDGVYCFKKRSVRDKEAGKFANVYMSMDKKEMLVKYNISESEIRDGGFLMSGEVKDYLKSISSKNNKNITKDVDMIVPAEHMTLKGHPFRRIMRNIAKDYDVAEITMSNGEKYKLALKRVFFADNDCDFSRCGMVDSDGNITVKESVINDYLNRSKIVFLEQTLCECDENFIILRNCDDAYSPNFSRGENNIPIVSHYFSEIILNMSQIVSIVGQDGYPDINLTHISHNKNKLIYTYLINNS